MIHAGANFNVKIEIEWIDSKKLENNDGVEMLKEFKGVIVPGGFGESGVEGKINAIKYCRENNIPFLGLCYGLQLAVVEFARNICGMTNAHTTEINKETQYPVIDILETQKELMEKKQYGGSMRLGAYAAILDDSSNVFSLYRETGRILSDQEKLKKLEDKERVGVLNQEVNVVIERHRHRFEVNPKFINQIKEAGMSFSGWHKREDGTELMEFIELRNHKFFMATQAHPEFKSRLDDPAPLFYGFVKAAIT